MVSQLLRHVPQFLLLRFQDPTPPLGFMLNSFLPLLLFMLRLHSYCLLLDNYFSIFRFELTQLLKNVMLRMKVSQ